MNITICEDERYWSDLLKEAISQWAASRNIGVNCRCFSSPEGLLEHLAAGGELDVLFLDISLGEEALDGLHMKRAALCLANYKLRKSGKRCLC